MRESRLDEAIALPLQSAIAAQYLAIQQTLYLIEEYGLKGNKTKTIEMMAERVVEERTIDKNGLEATKLETRPFEISIPLLALLPPPYMKIDEMNVEFGVEVIEPRRVPMKCSAIAQDAVAHSLSSTIVSVSPPNLGDAPAMTVKLKIIQESPEGLSRIVDLLTESLSGRPIEQPKMTVRTLKGITIAEAKILERYGIGSLEDLIEATETDGMVLALSRDTGLAELLIKKLREESMNVLRKADQKS